MQKLYDDISTLSITFAAVQWFSEEDPEDTLKGDRDSLKRNIMQQRNDISSFDAILDAKYGAEGTAEREAFRKEATNYCVGQIIPNG